MATQPGLRERKKQLTRRLIFDAAQRLFGERGFDRVSVAEIARAADVSEVTVFNYFPTKEDLFYSGMEFFEERLIESVRSRRAGESAIRAFRRGLLAGADRLMLKESADAILAADRVVLASPSLFPPAPQLAQRSPPPLSHLPA